ncbi:MAG: hypothetical protein Fur0014_18750 [Rubrivivax sp.]
MKIEGPSFPWRVRALATALLAAVLALGLRAATQVRAEAVETATALGAAVLLASVVLGWLSILRSRTVLDDEAVTQRWLFRRRVKLADITEVRLVAPASPLRWFVVPRLMVRTGGLRVTAFHLGDERLIAAMRALLERGRVKPG